jgi:beta-galactosidase beta subunit
MNVMQFATQGRTEKGRAARQYIDIQLLLAGEERILLVAGVRTGVRGNA